MKFKPFFFLSILVLLPLFLIPRIFFGKKAAPEETYEASDFILGTFVKIKVYEPPLETLFEDIFEEIREYEALLSPSIFTSDVSRLNRAAGLVPVKVDPLVFSVLKEGLDYSQDSEGRFDITVGPLVNLWRIGYDDARVPSREEIAEALLLIDYRNVELDEEEGTVFLRQRGMEVDLGAIAKGFIADRVAETLRSAGFEQAIINLGGNVLLLGAKPGNLPFRIGIQNPREAQGQPAGFLQLKNLSLVSSGDYERFFLEGNKRYHHILDTATGYPTDTELSSVTIVSPRSVDGDGLSTLAFILGLNEGYRFIRAQEGMEAVFITKDLSVYLTPGLEGNFTPGSADFTVKPWEEAP